MRWEDQRRSDNVEDRRGMRVPGGMAGGGIGTIRHRAAHLVDHRREPADAVPGGRRPRRRRPGAGAAGPDRRAGQRPAGRVRRGGPRRHRGHLGRGCSSRAASAISRPRSCSSTTPCNRPAARTPPRSARSTARSIRRSTSTSASSASWTSSSARPATSPRPTSSPTKWAITCRPCSASPSASSRCASVPARSRATGCRCMQELQADCFAGVWGHHANRKSLLEAGDVEEGLRAAASIGDDMMQRRGQRPGLARVVDPRLVGAARRVAAARARRKGTIDACDYASGQAQPPLAPATRS